MSCSRLSIAISQIFQVRWQIYSSDVAERNPLVTDGTPPIDSNGPPDSTNKTRKVDKADKSGESSLDISQNASPQKTEESPEVTRLPPTARKSIDDMNARPVAIDSEVKRKGGVVRPDP